MSTPSLLETVAQHEQGLVQELTLAEDEARRVTEAAQQAAVATTQEALARLDGEILERRRKAAADRDAACQAVEQEALARVSAIRAESAGRLGAVEDEILHLVLPQAH